MSGSRAGYTLGFLISAAVISGSIYLQSKGHFDPCTMCNIQRLFLGILGLLFLIALLHRPGRMGDITYGFLTLLLAGFGGTMAIKQLLLQQTHTVCMIGEKTIPLIDMSVHHIIIAFTNSSSNCGKPQFLFHTSAWYTNLTSWSLATFIILSLIGLVKIFKK